MANLNAQRELTKDDVDRLRQIAGELKRTEPTWKEVGLIPDQVDRDVRYLQIVADVIEYNIK